MRISHPGCCLAVAAALASPLAAAPPTTINVDDSSLQLRLWEDRGVPHYAISLDGVEFAEPRAADYRLLLRYATFDPAGLEAEPVVPESLRSGADTNLVLVQFVTQPLPEYRRAISEAGASTHQFIPNHALVVRLDDPAARETIEQLPFVRWVGDFHPAYRVEPFILEHLDQLDEVLPVQRYNIMVLEPTLAMKSNVADRIAELGGFVDRVNAGKYLVEATLTPEQLRSVLRFDDVLYVDRWSPYGTDMDVARDIGGANYVESVAGYTGAGVRGEVLDVGFNTAHVDFASRPLILHTAVNDDSHGAACSGIVFGDGTGAANKRGMLPNAQGIIADWQYASVGQSRYDHTGELVQSPYFAVFQSASVGSTRTTLYSNISADTDAMLFDFDIVHCQSQSNAGNQDSRPQAWAKNVVSVGGVRHQGTLSRADDCWGCGASAASIGPADDGRIKPDLCSFYDNIGTVTSGGATAYTEGFGGTSGATPIVAGHFGLFFEMWGQGIFGNSVEPLGTVFFNRCHMTTAKAMLINTAYQYDWSAGGSNGDIDRFKQGWGMPDVQALYDQRDNFVIIDEEDLVSNLGTREYTIAVDPGEPMFKATMTYADPPGTPGATMHRVNDLSLRVTTPSGTQYWGNNGLIAGRTSTPGGSSNTIDTVENVFIANPEAGLWTVEVIATELIEDGHVETPTLDADFALVVSGGTKIDPELTIALTSTVPVSIEPDTQVSVTADIVAGTESVVEGSELLYYRFDAAGPFQTRPLLKLNDVEYRSSVPGANCDATPEFYIEAMGDGGTIVRTPAEAPSIVFTYEVGADTVGFVDDFETDAGWTVQNIDLLDGGWDRGVPIGGGDRGDPATDYDGSGACWLTDNVDDNSDVDGGPTILTSPTLDASVMTDPVVSYARWFSNDDQDIDRLVVEVSDNDGASWVQLESIADAPGWIVSSFRVADFVNVNNQFRIRFTVSDNPNDSVTEAAVDALMFTQFVCEDVGEPPVVGDLDGDGDVDFDDLVSLLAAWGDCPASPCTGDIDTDGDVDFNDLITLLANWS